MALDQVDIDQIDIEPNKKKPNDEMSFWEHLEELRSRLIRSIIAIAVGMVGVFALGDWIFDTIIYAPRHEDFVTYRFMCWLGQQTGMQGLCIKPVQFEMFTTEMGESFFKQTQVAIVLGLIVASPYIFYQFWLFIKPGLTQREIKASNGFVAICTSLFVTGVLFGYFIIAPFAISFLASYTIGGVGGKVTLDSYIGFMTMFTLPIGLVFELPILIYFLSKLGLITPKFLREYRRYTIVILLIVAGVITPSPDMISQILVFIPLYTLYEVGIIVSARVAKQRELERAQYD